MPETKNEPHLLNMGCFLIIIIIIIIITIMTMTLIMIMVLVMVKVRYHRRLNRTLHRTMCATGVDGLDFYVCKRMYDYTGHLVRALAENPMHLTGMLLEFRDAQWKASLTEVVGHQGHGGRFAPWNWERQYHVFVR